MKKPPNLIDKHVGGRVRARRLLLGVSQVKLGEALSVTFQQVQKYEKGTSRIGASRLQQIARTLNIPPAFFFEGLPQEDGSTTQVGFAEDNTQNYIADFISSAEGLHLNRAFAKIANPKLRKRVVDLVTTIAMSQETPENDLSENEVRSEASSDSAGS